MNIPVLFRNHYQMGYVVRDMEKAIANLKEKFGVANWHVRSFGPEAPVVALGRAYVQRVMIELVQATPNEKSIYSDWIPASDSALRLHHFGYLIDSEEDWRQAIAQCEAAGCPAAMAGSAGEIVDFYYADTVAQLGHYCELIRLKIPSEDYFAEVPRN
ncbi:MAG: hypothetical protein EPO08_07765 [Rhodospirillaceae bacterium]|nr:MAG: hypothetical protein EPO08_07765 [Rhodospirillaceae bacterium]